MADEDITEGQVEEAEAAVEEELDEDDPKAFLEKMKKVIKIDLEDAGVLRKRMNITVPRETIQEELDKQYSELISEAVVPGFRRGRAPRRLVEKRFGSDVGPQVNTSV